MLYLGPLKQEQNADSVIDTDWKTYYEEKAREAKHPMLQQFYSRGTYADDTPINEVDLIAMDFETTGFSPTENGIVSVGLVPFNLKRIKTSSARQWLVDPGSQLNETSVTVHRITHSEIGDAPDLKSILPELLELLEGKVAVVHYRQIERPFLNEAIKARLGEEFLFPLIDTLELETRIQSAKPLSLWDKLRRKRPKSVRLDASRSRYNLPAYQPHHAVTDSVASAELFQAQIAHCFSEQTPVGKLWC